MNDHDFNPDRFTVVPPKTFEQLAIGDVSRAPSRTLTAAHALAFQSVSADNHPIHYDAVYAARHGHAAPVVHGLQVLAFTAPGATLFPQLIGEVFIAFTEVAAQFLGEVHARRHPLSGAHHHRPGPARRRDGNRHHRGDRLQAARRNRPVRAPHLPPQAQPARH